MSGFDISDHEHSGPVISLSACVLIDQSAIQPVVYAISRGFDPRR
jgi:hypothetical protein